MVDRDEGVEFLFLRPLVIAICDGMGGRLTSDVLDYIVWLFALEGWPFILAVLWLMLALHIAGIG